mmetsp:Transcript_3094/g.6929  ORF Transcript_3094/g.6929 Transcript_3094/m.6929 type:complete len:232 (-) Transcript_3094:2234-2929(-)
MKNLQNCVQEWREWRQCSKSSKKSVSVSKYKTKQRRMHFKNRSMRCRRSWKSWRKNIRRMVASQLILAHWWHSKQMKLRMLQAFVKRIKQNKIISILIWKTECRGFTHMWRVWMKGLLLRKRTTIERKDWCIVWRPRSNPGGDTSNFFLKIDHSCLHVVRWILRQAIQYENPVNNRKMILVERRNMTVRQQKTTTWMHICNGNESDKQRRTRNMKKVWKNCFQCRSKHPSE